MRIALRQLIEQQKKDDTCLQYPEFIQPKAHPIYRRNTKLRDARVYAVKVLVDKKGLSFREISAILGVDKSYIKRIYDDNTNLFSNIQDDNAANNFLGEEDL